MNCEIETTKHCNSNKDDHGPLRDAFPRGGRFGIVMFHLLFEACEHNFLLNYSTQQRAIG